jgi:RNA polymerase sigma-70 factor (ECF subfamily)
MTDTLDSHTAEERFRAVFSHLGAVAAYARRRGNGDADAVAAEVMTIAWRRLADVPLDDPRPWLYATARNLVLADARRSSFVTTTETGEPVGAAQAPEVLELDPALGVALRSLSRLDREALLLVAWEDLTPTQAARSLGINPTAFRVRLLRARRRLRAKLAGVANDDRFDPNAHFEMEAS